MRKSLLTSATAAALAAGVLAIAHPAAADDGIRHVDNTAETCTDTGAGAASAPFCTVGAAVAGATAGQTVEIRGDHYDERVAVTGSGTPEQPITIRFVGATGLAGDSAGFVIDGVHDIRLENVRVHRHSDTELAPTQPLLELRDASAVTVHRGLLARYWDEPVAIPVVRLTDVTDSRLSNFTIDGTHIVGSLLMDAGTERVTVDSIHVRRLGTGIVPAAAAGIRVEGSRNAVLNTFVQNQYGTGIQVGPSATDTVIANNRIQSGGGNGIQISGATGTAVTNNSVLSVCKDGIRADENASGVSIQNNVLDSSGLTSSRCDNSSAPGPHMALNLAEGVTDAVIDYNNVYNGTRGSSHLYSWNGTAMSLATFRAETGQATHDRQAAEGDPGTWDSANSAAPGFQQTDRYGKARVDDLQLADTGTGPITYADRGATEQHIAPTVRGSVGLDLPNNSVTVDASASRPRTAPIASYEFDFGDGTLVSETSPVASHRYQETGEYTVQITAIANDGQSSTMRQQVSVLRRTSSLGLLAKHNNIYVAAEGGTLRASQVGLTEAGKLDLVDAGSGQVAIYVPTHGAYVSVDPLDGSLTVGQTIKVDDPARFTMTRDADGSISLKSVANGLYVSVDEDWRPVLIARSTGIGIREKLHQVMVSSAAQTMKAGANGRFVTAEDGGEKPLIANRTSTGGWERFDLIDLGNGQVALFSHANRQFVTAENAGEKPLIAKRTGIGGWEKFTLVRNSDGTVSFKAAANNRYVSADEAGAKPLIANRTSIGGWEKFTLG